MNKQIEYLQKLHNTGGVDAVVDYLKSNRVDHSLKIETFKESRTPAAKAKSDWIAAAAPNEFRDHYESYIEKSKTGISQTRLRAYSIILK